MRGAGEWEGKVGRGEGEEGVGTITFLRSPAPPAPRLLALFAVGLRLHMLSQIPCKGMRTDSGIAGGQGPVWRLAGQAPGQHSARVLRSGGRVQPRGRVQDGTEELGRVGEGL